MGSLAEFVNGSWAHKIIPYVLMAPSPTNFTAPYLAADWNAWTMGCDARTRSLNSYWKCIACKIPLSTSIQWNSIYRIVSGRFGKLFARLRLLFVGDDVIYCSMLTTHIWQSIFEVCDAVSARSGQWPMAERFEIYGWMRQSNGNE